jgi:hypothetical protein
VTLRWQVEVRCARPLLRFSPSDMTKISLKGLLRAFEIRPSIETVALDKSGFMGMQQMPIERERDQLQFVFKDHSITLLSFCHG